MTAPSVKVTYAEDLGTEVVSIYVGPERKHYVVHKRLLTSQSDYFDKALNGGFKEAEENKIHLEEDDPAAVGLLVGWLYRGVIPGTGRKPGPFSLYMTGGVPPVYKPHAVPPGTLRSFVPYNLIDLSNPQITESFPHICFSSYYQGFSQEELRLVDYQASRKFASSSGSFPSPLPILTVATPPNPAGQSLASNRPSPFGLLGASQSRGLFGSQSTTPSLTARVPPVVPPGGVPAGPSTTASVTAPVPNSAIGGLFRSPATGTTTSVPSFQGQSQTFTGSILNSSSLTQVSHGNSGTSFVRSAGSLFGESSPSELASPALFAPPTPKNPGEFGYSLTIEYPKSEGNFIDGIPRSEPVGEIVVDEAELQNALLHLCLLAETICWPKLFNAAVDAYVQREFDLRRDIPLEHVDLIYTRTHLESTLRDFVMNSIRRLNKPQSHRAYMELAQQHEEFLEDLLKNFSLSSEHTNSPNTRTYFMSEYPV